MAVTGIPASAADAFRPAIEALKQTADGLIIANQGIKAAADAILAARDEHEDLRETVHRLENLVTELTKELRTLRNRSDAGDGHRAADNPPGTFSIPD